MSAVTVQLDEDLVALLNSSNQSLQHTASELMVLELYRRGTISSGTAAQLLGMERIRLFNTHHGSVLPFLI